MFFDSTWPSVLQPVPAIARQSDASRRATARRQDELLDEALKETFPASDPVSGIRIS